MEAIVSVQTQLRLQLADGKADQFPQAKVYDPTGTLDATVNLTHVAGGLYSGNWTPSVLGVHSAQFIVYTDAGHITENGSYDRTIDEVSVVRKELTFDNSVLDSQVYDALGNLDTARLRMYDTEANALAAGATGLIDTFNVTTAYTAGELTGYTMVRVGS